MWHSRMYNSEMDSPLPQAQQRPWTPPETDVDDDTSPHSDYFSDPFRPSPAFSADLQHRWSSHPDAMSEKMGVRCDTPTEAQNPRSRPKPANRATEPAPYTPVKHLSYGVQHADGALRYPYTPDSSRILRRHNTDIPSSPMPWDEFSEPESSPSPVQDALSSCIAQFENLIHSQQPDEEQMEYIVAQFEAMTSFLSAPDAQSKTTDDHLFEERELGSLGLGILNDETQDRAARVKNMSAQANDAYVAEVGAYIDGVKKYIEDLKMRLDEVKTLNSIQLDVIHDLRRQMRSVRQGMRTSLDMRDEITGVETELDKIAPPNQTTSNPSASKEKPREFGIDSWETLVDDSEHAQPAIEKAEASSPASSSKPRKSVQFDESPRYKVIHIVRKPERRSFWASFGEALDSFGALLRDDE